MSDRTDTRAKASGLLWPGVLAVLGLAILLALGTWQLQRMHWKNGLLAQIEARAKAEPANVQSALRRLTLGENIEYTRVRIRGHFRHDDERFIYAPDAKSGPGHLVVTPLEIADSPWVALVNRGYIPAQLKDPANRSATSHTGNVEIVGLVRMPTRPSLFSAEADANNNVWYWRDHAGIAKSIPSDVGKTMLPFFIDAESTAGENGFPRGGVTRLNLPNRHLEYALTWFGLAGTLVVVFGFWAWGRMRGDASQQ